LAAIKGFSEKFSVKTGFESYLFNYEEALISEDLKGISGIIMPSCFQKRIIMSTTGWYSAEESGQDIVLWPVKVGWIHGFLWLTNLTMMGNFP
jgi:hypothetical protein